MVIGLGSFPVSPAGSADAGVEGWADELAGVAAGAVIPVGAF